ncbi:MAG: pyrroline-5-carboxylate reductase [Oceanospirillaceae bacterium]|nr:pyrroline-5-carboxylate reductase [Oceanospirillaceae bacterium]
MQPTIAFIGAGNMSRAIFGGMLKNGYPAKNITATGRNIDKLADLAALGLNVTTDNAQAIKNCKVIVLGVKPQMMQEVCKPLAALCQEHQPLIISVAAGISAQSLEQWLGGNLAVVRCMPNTPALVQQGASALCANQNVTQGQKDIAEQIIAATGLAIWVDNETQLNAVTALSGSGPAYFFLLMESMIDAAVSQGLSTQVATQLALQTARGAAEMAQSEEDSPAQLRRKITSPKGTTEQAILSFQGAGFAEIIKNGMQANIDRSEQLAIEFGDAPKTD